MGNLDSIHVRRWVEFLVERGLEVHFASLRRPESTPVGVELHVLRDTGKAGGTVPGAARRAARGLPPGLARLASAWRYRSAGLEAVVRKIAPDVLHAHYVSDYGVIAAGTGFRPLVLSAWGSDVLVDVLGSPLTRRMVRNAIRAAALTTYDSDDVAAAIKGLAGPGARLLKVVFGVRRAELEAPPVDRADQVLSARSLEPNYRVGSILEAWAEIEADVVGWRLAVAGGGSQAEVLSQSAREGGLERVAFLGRLDRDRLLEELARSRIYVSVPASDGASATLLEAMALGCYPVVSDLPANREWIADGENGIVVKDGLGGALRRAIAVVSDPAASARAATLSRRRIEEEGIFEDNLERMLDAYRELAARTPRR